MSAFFQVTPPSYDATKATVSSAPNPFIAGLELKSSVKATSNSIILATLGFGPKSKAGDNNHPSLCPKAEILNLAAPLNPIFQKPTGSQLDSVIEVNPPDVVRVPIASSQHCGVISEGNCDW